MVVKFEELITLGCLGAQELVPLGCLGALDGCGASEPYSIVVKLRGFVGSLQLSCGESPNLVCSGSPIRLWRSPRAICTGSGDRPQGLPKCTGSGDLPQGSPFVRVR